MSDENVRDRREMLLQAVVDGDADSINPRDYTEKLLAEAAEGDDTRSNAREHADLFINEIIGGTPAPAIDVISLSATENTTYTAPEGKAYSPVTVNVPNPNSVVTVNGTLGSPFGNIVPSELLSAVQGDTATAELMFTYEPSTDYTLMMEREEGGTALRFGYTFGTPLTGWTKTCFCQYTNTGVSNVRIIQSSGAIVQIDAETACTLKVIYHPLPTV